MKVAVTGASGFIGRQVLTTLLNYKLEVIAITRHAERLNDLNSRTCRIVEMDIANFESDRFDKLDRPDMLIHLAWDGLPNYRSLHHFSTELPNHYQFLATLVKDGLSSLLVTGTCFEYGMQSGALSEETLTIPNNPYGYAKDALRQQLQFLQATQPFNLIWARLFYMYGEDQPNSSLYPKLKGAVRRKDKVFNLSGGEQLRDYLPVESVANYIVRLALTQQNLGVVNISSGEPISVRRLVENWRKEQNWQIEFNFGYYPYPDYEPMAFWGDSTKLLSIL
jgi:dTDP-6-deoxy-L-talose 4-dehydrogenase (NAD+)